MIAKIIELEYEKPLEIFDSCWRIRGQKVFIESTRNPEKDKAIKNMLQRTIETWNEDIFGIPPGVMVRDHIS